MAFPPLKAAVPAVLWNDGELSIRDDGFLWVNNVHDLEEDQPLLLYSTELLLQTLYPSISIESIFEEPGYLEEVVNASLLPGSEEEVPVNVEDQSMNDKMEGKETMSDIDVKSNADALPVDVKTRLSELNNPTVEGAGEIEKTRQDEIPAKYQIYQSLARANCLGDKILSALLDIQYFRHRKKRDKDRVRLTREEMKIRALEFQQERLLSQRSSSTGVDDDFPENEDDKKEPSTVRLARTINSIRALFPHLLPILNHPNCSDKELQIGANRWKAKKKPMCWLLGTKTFDTTTSKIRDSAHRDVKGVLEGFVSIETAAAIAFDPCGAPGYWSKCWIEQIVQKSKISIVNPLMVLAGEEGLDEVKLRAQSSDDQLLIRKNETPEEHQRYNLAIKRLHQRISSLLSQRFPNSRLSIYGSCLSDLSIGQASDVDLSLWLPEAAALKADFGCGGISASKYEKQMKQFVYQACRKLEHLNGEFRNMQPVTRARVPVLKGTFITANNPHTQDGSIK